MTKWFINFVGITMTVCFFNNFVSNISAPPPRHRTSRKPLTPPPCDDDGDDVRHHSTGKKFFRLRRANI